MADAVESRAMTETFIESLVDFLLANRKGKTTPSQKSRLARASRQAKKGLGRKSYNKAVIRANGRVSVTALP